MNESTEIYLLTAEVKTREDIEKKNKISYMVKIG